MPAKTRVSAPRRQRPPRRRAGHAKHIPGNPFVALLETVRTDVESRLSGFLDSRLESAMQQGTEVADLLQAIRDLCLRGGKRLRPALVVAGFRAAKAEDDIEPALDLGVAVELLHAYFLIHDDWMDEDMVRRGGPTAHAHFAKKYRSAHLGAAAAILTGDFALALATEAMAKVEAAPRRLPALFSTFAQMQVDAVAGQQLDLLATNDVERTYMLKTGSYTVRGPLLLGAILAGASARACGVLERYALPTGVAFQLRDDVLSAFGDPKATGKPRGTDIRGGKRTLLVHLARDIASRSDREILKAAWGNRRATPRQIDRAVAVLDRSGARQQVEARIDELIEKALATLETDTLTTPGKELLRGAAEALTQRRI